MPELLRSLEVTIAKGLADEAEVEARARMTYLTARQVELEASQPFMDIKTSDLELQAEEAEERREDARDRLEQERSRGNRVNKARVRRLKRAFNEASEERLRLVTEVQRRAMARINQEGFASRALAEASSEGVHGATLAGAVLGVGMLREESC